MNYAMMLADQEYNKAINNANINKADEMNKLGEIKFSYSTQLNEAYKAKVDEAEAAEAKDVDKCKTLTTELETMLANLQQAAQQAAAQAAISRLEAESGQPVKIAVEPFKSFWTAEEEHQDYYLKHPEEFRQELIDSGRLKL